jgi:hypothetical protein
MKKPPARSNRLKPAFLQVSPLGVNDMLCQEMLIIAVHRLRTFVIYDQPFN